MEIVRKELAPLYSGVNPQRYDDTTGQFQEYVNGEWVDAPQSDPRNQILTPLLDTSDPRCDAAARMTGYVHDTVDGLIDGLQATATAFTLFSGIYAVIGIFGQLWALFAALASEIVAVATAAGYEDLQDNFDTAFYDRLLCYFVQSLNTGGELTAAGKATLESKLSTESTTVQNIMGALLAFTGTALFNAMASTRTETGDCADCGGWCQEFFFDVSNGTWYCGSNVYVTCGANYVGGTGWSYADQRNGSSSYSRMCWIVFDLPAEATIEHIEFDWQLVKAGFDGNITIWYIQVGASVVASQLQGSVVTGNYTKSWDGSINANHVEIFTRSQQHSSPAYAGSTDIIRVLMRGSGANPFESSNCE